MVVQDAGRAINPIAIEGPMLGGVVKSLGIALSEAFMYDDRGRLLNSSLLDDRNMTAIDGARLTELPLNPERIAVAPNSRWRRGRK